MDSFEYVRQYYGVPACIGRRVLAYGRPGVITEDRGHYIGVTLDSDKPGTVTNYHPIDGIEYLGIGKIRKKTKASERYRRFLEFGEMFDSFIDFCRWDAEPERSWAVGRRNIGPGKRLPTTPGGHKS